MSKKRKVYTAEFKARLVLEGIDTVNQIASKYEVQPLNLRNWKKLFLENMSLAFDKSTVVKEEIEVLKKDKDELAKKVGNLTIEKDFLEGKLVSLASSKERKTLLDTKHNISLNKQCKLLQINKSSLYYKAKKPFRTSTEINFLAAIYGYRSPISKA